MFDRYNITSESDLADAAQRIQACRDAQKASVSGLNSDKNRDSDPRNEGLQIAPEPLNLS
jgi:hypothetical protein